MEAIFKVLLTIHVISGFTALLAGVVPMIAKKGGKIHNRFGLIYFWAMVGSFATSQPMAILHNNVFLFTVGIFSFYFVFTGYRFAKRKGYEHLTRLDKSFFQLTFLTSILMIGYAIYWMSQGTNQGWIVLGVFGILCFKFSWTDLKKFDQAEGKNRWIIEHLNRMLGGYIATFTAFTVTNLAFLPPLVGWLVPGLIGGIGIAMTVKHFKKKYRLK